ncbi:MAG: 6,7-dimethyl-8-ribityllumazine synthase [Candidatus Nanopelagicales bacterium]
MSGQGAAELIVPQVDGAAVAIVAASWHDEVMAGLIAGAVRVCEQAGARAEVFRVPGSFELPLGAQAAARAGFGAVIALGVVIRGGTPHFEYVCRAATDGLVRVALDSATPLGFGLLTCDDDDQARDRAGLPGSSEDKGAEAAMAALHLLVELPKIRPSVARPATGFGAP